MGDTWGVGLGKNRVKELISYNPTKISKTADWSLFDWEKCLSKNRFVYYFLFATILG